MFINNCLTSSTKISTEITIRLQAYDDLAEEGFTEFVVDTDSPLSSFIDFLCEKFKVPANIIFISFHGVRLNPETTFAQNHVKENDILHVDFETEDSFDPQKANQSLIESAQILSDINLQLSKFQDTLNQSDIETVNNAFQELETFCNSVVDKLENLSKDFPTRY